MELTKELKAFDKILLDAGETKRVVLNVEIKDLRDILETKISSIDEGFNSEDDSNIGEMNVFNNYSSSFNGYEKISNDDFNNKLIANLLKKLPERVSSPPPHQCASGIKSALKSVPFELLYSK